MKWKSGLCLGLLLAALVPWTAAAQTAVGNFKWILIDGTKVSVGSGAPSGGSSGDVYIRTNGTIYTNISGVWTASASGGSGTVTSVGLSVPGLFAVSGTPVTTSGTIAVSLATQSANTVLAGPTSGAAAQPAFRSIVFGDWASNSCASGQIPKYNGSAWACADDAGASSGAPSAAQYVTLATDATLTNERVLTAGTGITVTDGGAGSTLTIAADGAAITSLNASNISSGTLAAARGGAGTVSGLLKANGSGAVSAATSGTDYAPATSGTAVLKGNGSGGFASAASGTDYAPATTGSAILSGNGAGGFSAVTIGTGLDFTGGTLSASGGGGGSTITFGIVIDGAGAVITTGVKGFIRVPVNATITKWTVLSSDAASTSGSIVLDLWKDSFASYPPTVADTITASAKPTLSSATKAESSTLTGWSTSITAGDVIGFNVDSASTVTRVTVEVEATVP